MAKTKPLIEQAREVIQKAFNVGISYRTMDEMAGVGKDTCCTIMRGRVSSDSTCEAIIGLREKIIRGMQ